MPSIQINGLLEVIKLAMYNENGKTHAPTLIHSLTAELYNQKQGRMSNKEWYETKVALVSSIVSVGGSVNYHPGLITELATKLAQEDGRIAANQDDINAATTEIEGASMGALVLCGSSANNDEYRADLANTFWSGVNNYPASGADAVEDICQTTSILCPPA